MPPSVDVVQYFGRGFLAFSSPKNEAHWLENQNGLRCDHYVTIFSVGQLELAGLDGLSCSLEIWLRPFPYLEEGHCLAFYSLLRHRQFSLQQFDTDLALRRDIGDEYQQTSLDVTEVFRKDREIFMNVNSDGRGTTVYIDGKLAAQSSRLGVPAKHLAAGNRQKCPGMIRSRLRTEAYCPC